MAKYVNVADVPLMRVGTWDASTGKESVTLADLQDIVDAYNSNDLDPAVLKLGHVDPRNDGDPAYGRVVNLRVTDERGGTLVGDYESVPEELAESLESAYPYRSVEIAKNVTLSDPEGNVTATYPAVLVGCALLGASAPAVKGLGPVHAKLSANMNAGTVAVFGTGQFTLQGGLTTNQLRQAIQSALYERGGPSASVDDAWLEDFDDTLAWYHRDGGMFQSTYTVDAAGAVTLTGDPVPVREKRVFEPVRDTPQFPQGFTESTQPENNHPAGVSNESTKETAEMAFTDKQLTAGRKLLNLPETSTEADVLDALDALEGADAHEAENAGKGNPAPGTVPGDGTGDQPKVATPPAPAAAPTVQETVNASAAPTETVQVSAVMFSALQESHSQTVAKLAAIEAERDKDRRDGIIRSAFSAGKLHRTEIEPWRKSLDENEGVTVTLLSARAAVFPVVEIGHDVAPAAFSLTPLSVSEAELAADNALFKLDENGAK